ncbi:MAG: N-6 DNA methylase [Candidatus Omnitrophota bacterium]
MAIDLTGINNENEFYTNHYLSAIFENDVKDVLSRWKENEKENLRTPYAQIKTLSKNYFSFTNSFEKEKSLEIRIEQQRQWLQLLLPALGYDLKPMAKTLDAGFDIPILYEEKKSNGAPDMWIIEVINLYGDDQDPLSLSFCKEQFQAQEMSKELIDIALDTVITKFVFGMAEPPRWIIAINDSQAMLIDRSKWNEKRMLRFDLPEILGRKEDSTLKAMAALLHKESICPDDGIPLLDTLDENSHKHAFSVSEDLKYALREAIELLGNEAVYYLQEVRRKGVFSGEEKINDKDLTRECLRYMYRLLFILYIEARPELGYVPMKSDAYRLGYSFESLRGLEIVKLNSEESKKGYFINDSIQILFELIYKGVSGAGQREMNFQNKTGRDIFEIPALKTHLFDPERTPILNKVKFRNIILQRVIELMSLSRQGGRNSRRGRISYAQLGINQLGAVYEALLSYQGFFAQTDLYEVKKADEPYDKLKNAYFVKAEDLEKYTDEEKVCYEDGSQKGKLKKYEKGTFIYRLAGRDREKSASYYTPEVLTKCLVKYALKELLKDKSADEILKLTVCEPAMGSAAFLNEAINQIAEAYLDRKQKEKGERIAHDEYTYERQKVKMYIADNNVFGVDLNPVAVELAEVSLWLNTISKENFVPWFGMQLVCGNSLIGARRQVFKKTLLKKENRTDPIWLDEVPERVMPTQKRNADTVYHFLLPDKGMSDYKDKVIKQLAGENIKKINNWRNDFTKEFSKREIKTLQKLSDTIDKLWSRHTEQQRDMRERTTDIFAVWGQEQSVESRDNTGMQWKDKVLEQELLSKKVRNSSPYRRLKLAMDYWCSLWFWPIEKAGLLPSREEYLLDLNLILEGNPIEVTHGSDDQLMLFSDTMSKQMQMKFVDELGVVDIDKLCAELERLALVQELSETYRFLHWELEFADLFDDRGGFDLVLGNPPWIKLIWEEGGVLGDIEPSIILKKLRASDLGEKRGKIFNKKIFKDLYVSEYEYYEGLRNYLHSSGNFDVLKGSSANLYKCFLPISWYLNNNQGVSGFITDEGIYNHPTGLELRKTCYQRLKKCFYFKNEKMLFSDVGHAKKFEMVIFGEMGEPAFELIANLFHPSTIDYCYLDNGKGIIPGIKNENGDWEVLGHKNRIITINKSILERFANIYEGGEKHWLASRLPAIHSQESLQVILKLFSNNETLGQHKDDYIGSFMLSETGSQKIGIIKRETNFPKDLSELVLSGPNIYIGNFLYKTPRSKCTEKAHFDVIDLENVDETYLPRTNYLLKINKDKYKKSLTNLPWSKEETTLDCYRLVARKMLNHSSSRTFISAIAPPYVSYIDSCFGLAFKNKDYLLSIAGFSFSLLSDYFIRSIGKSNFTDDSIRQFPIISNHIIDSLNVRVLCLSAIGKGFKDLWESEWRESYTNDSWTKVDNRLREKFFSKLTNTWTIRSSLRNEFERRQALIEIDVLIAIALNLKLNELISIYRVEFPIFRGYEQDTWYDQNGRIVFTCSKGLPGVGFSRAEWNEIKDMKAGTVERKIIDDTQPGGPKERIITYHAPFDRCDREKDYEGAWKEFEKRFKDKKDNK